MSTTLQIYRSHSHYAKWTYRWIIFHTCVKTKPNAKSTWYVIAHHATDIHIATKLGINTIYTKYFIAWKYIYIYMSHMKSLPLSMQQGVLYKYLTYISEDICLLHCKLPNCPCSISTTQLELLLWRARPNSPMYLQDTSNQNVVSVYNNMKAFVPAKKQYKFSKISKSPGVVASTNDKTFNW